eukprot:gene7811-8008_t
MKPWAQSTVAGVKTSVVLDDMPQQSETVRKIIIGNLTYFTQLICAHAQGRSPVKALATQPDSSSSSGGGSGGRKQRAEVPEFHKHMWQALYCKEWGHQIDQLVVKVAPESSRHTPAVLQGFSAGCLDTLDLAYKVYRAHLFHAQQRNSGLHSRLGRHQMTYSSKYPVPPAKQPMLPAVGHALLEALLLVAAAAAQQAPVLQRDSVVVAYLKPSLLAHCRPTCVQSAAALAKSSAVAAEIAVYLLLRLSSTALAGASSPIGPQQTEGRQEQQEGLTATQAPRNPADSAFFKCLVTQTLVGGALSPYSEVVRNVSMTEFDPAVLASSGSEDASDAPASVTTDLSESRYSRDSSVTGSDRGSSEYSEAESSEEDEYEDCGSDEEQLQDVGPDPQPAQPVDLELQQWPKEAQQVALSFKQQQQATGVSCDSLDPRLAAEFMAAVYETVQQQQVMPEQQLQLERYKLQAQEFKYYAAANKERMPALPDLSDNSGGLSNRLYFNFVSYVLWKVVARHLPSADARTAFCAAVGQQLLQRLAPDVLADVEAARAAATQAGTSRAAPARTVIAAVQRLLSLLQQGGYICGQQLVLGGQPGTWPADWDTQDSLVDDFGLLDGELGPLQAGIAFQIKLKLPADIEGAVALRAEEDGFWSRQVSSMLVALFQAAGYSSPAADEYFYQDYWAGPSSAADKLLLLLGDPLQQVAVPWTPTTLVQNWVLA